MKDTIDSQLGCPIRNNLKIKMCPFDLKEWIAVQFIEDNVLFIYLFFYLARNATAFLNS